MASFFVRCAAPCIAFTAACAAPPVPREPPAAPPAEPSAPAVEPAPVATGAKDAGPVVEPAVEAPAPTAGPRVIRFSWKPARGPDAAYAMEAPEDQHRLVLPPGLEPGAEVPVVVGFHGQPARGRDPGGYWFPGAVEELTLGWVREGRLRPFVLVLPVFRFVGSNWPGFDPRAFRAKVEELLEAEGLRAGPWYAFGHSGAAGCGGDGLNQVFRLAPAAAGFFDTCLGPGFVQVLGELEQRRTPTLVVHSVETAGFSPRQTPEYQSGFDFGLAYGPAGLAPIPCPEKHPGGRLRPQKWKCAASPGRHVRAFVIDSGEGAEAHQATVEPALLFFLEEYAGLSAPK
jgi:hypothetical protein